MQPQVSAPRDGIVIAHGYGLKLRVDRGHLVVHDGICDERQTRRYHRATSKLRRLIVVGHTGYITFDALRWLRDARAALAQIDADGQLLTTTAPDGPDLPALRREQALAATTQVGVGLARWIITAKTAGQATVMERLPATHVQRAEVEIARGAIQEADSLGEVLAAEARCAAAYWDAWANVSVNYGRLTSKMPEHWRTFHQRHSPLTRSPRLAINPPGAILNYLYALLEAETTFACHVQGLDPGIGIFHTDKRDRASLALDLMEAARPAVDAYLLALLTDRTLNARDFAETRRGGCRLFHDQAAQLAKTTTVWASHITPIVQQARALLDPNSKLAKVGDHHPSAGARHQGPVARIPGSCETCGQTLTSRRCRYCETCRVERFRSGAPNARQSAAAVLAQLRSEGLDPAHGGSAAKARGSKNTRHQQAIRAWAGERPDPAVFAAEILPVLRRASIRELVAATGLSEHYCSLIRLGKRTPHPRHWENLARLPSA